MRPRIYLRRRSPVTRREWTALLWLALIAAALLWVVFACSADTAPMGVCHVTARVALDGEATLTLYATRPCSDTTAWRDSARADGWTRRTQL